MRAIVFDLGDTLVEYEGLPLSWEAHYSAALQALGSALGFELSEAEVAVGRRVLRKYNTRLNPRTIEVQFADILRDLLSALSKDLPTQSSDLASAFFSVFRQRLRSFPDVQQVLVRLRENGVRTGVVTDVPYGMPGELVREDMTISGVMEWIDDLVTSFEVGLRKPDPAGLRLICGRLGSTPSEMTYVGNEKKDIEAALAFGCEAVLLDRNDDGPEWGQHRRICSLSEL